MRWTDKGIYNLWYSITDTPVITFLHYFISEADWSSGLHRVGERGVWPSHWERFSKIDQLLRPIWWWTTRSSPYCCLSNGNPQHRQYSYLSVGLCHGWFLGKNKPAPSVSAVTVAILDCWHPVFPDTIAFHSPQTGAMKVVVSLLHHWHLSKVSFILLVGGANLDMEVGDGRMVVRVWSGLRRLGPNHCSWWSDLW